MYSLIVFLPFISSIGSGFFGRFLGFYGSSFLSISCLFLAFMLSLLSFYEVALMGCSSYVKITSWTSSEMLHLDWGFMFDSLTVVMCCVVTFISCLVHLYSTEYMSHDPHLPRFMSYLSLFTFFMLILVTADNFIQMFVGWEGVGLCSYLLINFWYTRIQANKAAIKAMLMNRIGDFSLIIGIIIIFIYYKSVDYATVCVLTPLLKEKVISFLTIDLSLLVLIGILLFIGAVGKSAQLGLHTWLPDAMEGPTPVSALIHAATMVTAGVFLIARSSFLYEYSYNVLGYIVFIGAMTAFCASTIGLMQNDLKRVIAYSTCSQLGYMVFACGLSNYSVGIFHLSNHAFFKALLFLSAGSIIHAVNDEQDMRKMGGLKNLLPFTYTMVVIGSLALTGFPFLAGFYSKDLILEIAYSKFSYFGYFSYFFGSFGAFFTAFYSMRLLCLTFLTQPSGHKNIIRFAADAPNAITFVLGILAIPSIFVGFYTKDMIVGFGSDFFGTAIYIPLKNVNIFDAEFISLLYKLLPVILSLSGAILSFILYNFQFRFLFNLKLSVLGKKIYNFFNRKWFFDKIYNECFGQFFFKFGYSVSYKVRVNSLCKGLWRGTGKEITCFLRASVYSRFLDFNFGGYSTQRRSDLSISSLNPNLWVAEGLRLLILSLVFDAVSGMLVDKLNWKKSLPYTFESRKKLYLLGYRFGGGFDMRVSKLSDVNSVLIFNNNLMYNVYSKPIFITYRCFSSVPHKLKENFNKKTRKFENLFPIICSVENLQEAWFEIKSKPGNMTSGGEGIETLDGLSLDWFDKTSKKLLSGSYTYKLARRVHINKPGKNGKRPLTIGSSRDKIIQKAILRVLQYIYEGFSIWEATDFETFENYVDPNRHLYEASSNRSRTFEGFKIYEIRKWIIEPKFSHLSFGFRPNRSAHSALKLIKRTWSPIWFWSADLIKAFDKINYNRLISEIRKTIEDPKLMDEIRKMINVEIINFKVSESVKGLGTPQGNVLSSSLFNIYLSSLDFYVESLQSKYNREGSTIRNPEFRKRTRANQKKFSNLGFREQTKKVRFEQDKTIAEGIEPNVVVSKPVVIYYVRYVDDMLFGFNMDKSLAKKILNDVRIFIKSDLHLDCQTDSGKSKLIHGISNLTSFLGFQIGLYPTSTSFKSKHLTRFYKLKANLKRKKVMESERYFKMQERVLSKMHRDFLHSISFKGQTLIKSSRVKEVYDHKLKIKVIHALKKSLSNLEAEILAVPLVSHISKIVKKDPNTPFQLAEQKRHNLLKYVTTRWIQTAQELGSEEDFLELKTVVGEFLSPEFVASREIYLTELKKITSKDFNEKIIEKILKNAKSGPARIRAVSSVKIKRSVRILFPTEEYNKKLRSLGILSKNITRPTGVGFLTPLQDYDIINWFSLKVSGIWNYYSCADNIWDVKQLINWKLRYSLLGTLAMKHKSSIKQSINKYSISPTIFYEYEFKGEKVQSILAGFPDKGFIHSRKKVFNDSSLAPIELERIIRSKVNTLNAINIISFKCAVIGCGNDAEEIHHMRKLGRRLRGGVISTSGSHVLQGWKVFESALMRKQVPLCKSCHVKVNKSEITPDNLDLKFVFDMNKEV